MSVNFFVRLTHFSKEVGGTLFIYSRIDLSVINYFTFLSNVWSIFDFNGISLSWFELEGFLLCNLSDVICFFLLLVLLYGVAFCEYSWTFVLGRGAWILRRLSSKKCMKYFWNQELIWTGSFPMLCNFSSDVICFFTASVAICREFLRVNGLVLQSSFI